MSDKTLQGWDARDPVEFLCAAVSLCLGKLPGTKEDG